MKGYFVTSSNFEDKNNVFLSCKGGLSVQILTDKIFWVKRTRIVVTYFDKKITKNLAYPKDFKGVTEAYLNCYFDEILEGMAQKLGAKPDKDLILRL